MFEKLNQISDRVFNRYVTVEKNIKAASNSFYDSYLDMVEELLKFLAISDNIELTARMTCGDILHNLEIKAFLSDDLLVDEYTYCKLCDYTLKINAHKHKMEKNIQIETVINYLRIFINVVNAFFVYKKTEKIQYDDNSIMEIFGVLEKENASLKAEMQKLKDELLSSVESGKMKETDIETYKNLLSQSEIDKLSLEDQNEELQRQISVLKDIKLSSMEEKLNKTIDLLLELKPAIVENRILTKAVGRKVGGMISGDTNIEKWIADEKDKEQI